ncbi:MAG: biosynthetic-type acetolactate synthase large subunit [Oceanococcus sp.]
MTEDFGHQATSNHPLAGTQMIGADIVVQVLADEGVDTVFGYSGGAILPSYDAIFRYNQIHAGDDGEGPMPLIVPANEQGAGFMAAGYARASGKVGVALVTSGPGATNTVTPVRDCMADSIPIVVICGQVPTGAIGTDGFQEAPVSNIMGAAAKHVFLITDPEKLEATVRTAFEIARTGRPGPVVIDIPKDVQNWEGSFKGAGCLPVPGYRQRMNAVSKSMLSQLECVRFFDMLKESRRPLIYAGGGVINGEASEQLSLLAREFKIPVVTTLMGLGAFDTTDDLCMHMLGMHGTAYANYAVDDCDFLIAVGARFDDRVAGKPDAFAPNAKHIAHFDIDHSEIHKVMTADWHHVGELNQALDALIDYGRSNPLPHDLADWNKHLFDLKEAHHMSYKPDGDEIQPQQVIEEINRITKGEAIISTGVGQHQMYAAQFFDFRHPRLWLTSGSMGTMGFGLPAAIGAQFACPDKLVIDIDGDASIRMNIGELETATTYNLPVKIVVLNNTGDGMVRQWQKLFFKGRFSATDKSLHKKNFVKAAEADGFEWAQRVDEKAKLADTIRDFLAFDGPAFLEVVIDREAGVYPMVGPGMSYREMITGDHIPNRYEQGKSDVDAAEMF